MSASFVLASLRGSTYRSVRLASSLAAALHAERRVLARRGWAGGSLAFLSILRTVFPLPYRSHDDRRQIQDPRFHAVTSR